MSILKSWWAPAAFASVLFASPAAALTDCSALPSHAEAKAALERAVAADNGGFGLEMWVSIVNRDGEVCVVAFSGENRGDQWPGSRVISAQKANTANAFSLPGLALSTANLWAATQPGGSLFGLQFSNPVDPTVAYGKGGTSRESSRNMGYANRVSSAAYGLRNDPMVGKFIGGVNVFGGGLALYGEGGELLGALGVSGDSSCADHNIAWRVRDTLGLDDVPGGVSPSGDDNIIYDVATDLPTGHGVSAGGFGHPACLGTEVVVNAQILIACPPDGAKSPGCVPD